MSLRIMICDDAMFMRTVIATMFREAGHTIVGEAETGDQAIEMYRDLRPDIVTMDVVMPSSSGINATRDIVAGDPNARVIMCSAMGQERLINEALEAGACGFLVKPFDGDKLMNVVKEACEAKPKTQVSS
jgi:two-component system chemotaxis response regulator CheY